MRKSQSRPQRQRRTGFVSSPTARRRNGRRDGAQKPQGQAACASNTGRPAFERDARNEIDRDSGRMTWREQVFDRANDYWSETVIFQDTVEAQVPTKEWASE
jgi:hypothetical protein